MPKPKPPAAAFIKITKAPAGATYRIGDKTGTVSDDGTATIDEPPGDYVVELDKPGYEQLSKKVKVLAGMTTPLPAEMRVSPPPPPPPVGTPVGTLVVSANVDHFDVYIDGKPRPPNSGRSNKIKIDNVPAGSYKVEIKKTGYEEPKQKTVKIVANKESTPVYFDLKEEKKQPVATVITPPPPNNTTPAANPAPSTTATAAPPVVSTPPPSPPSLAKPVITSFRVEPATVEAGSKVKLIWSIQGADRVQIKPDNVTQGPKGSIDVEPKPPQTTYELIATGPGGDDTRSLVVTVRPKPDEKAEVVAAKDRWRSAYESMDPGKLHVAFPNIDKNLLDAIEKIRKKDLRLRVGYSGCSEPKVAGPSAEMSCTQSIAVVQNGQEMPPGHMHVTLQFAKQADRWVLSNLAASN